MIPSEGDEAPREPFGEQPTVSSDVGGSNYAPWDSYTSIVAITMSEPSPYAPPRADDYAAVPEVYANLRDASQGVRFLHLMLDGVGRVVFMFVLALPFSALGMEGLGGLSGVLGLFGYHFLFEVTLGRTPAKFITGTRVVSADGARPSAMQILGRTLARYVPFEPLSFVFGGDPPNGWHDKWSRT